MTNEMMSLPGLVEKSSDADLLREIVGFAAQRPMEPEVEGLTGAPHGRGARPGYRERTWETRAGTVELRIPKLRQKGSFWNMSPSWELGTCPDRSGMSDWDDMADALGVR